MMRINYELDTAIKKSTAPLKLCRSDKASIEVDKDTLTVAIKDNDEMVGHVFFGHGRLIIDTIVETENGAFGKPVDKELNQPFLMLGTAEEIDKHLAPATSDELKKLGGDDKEFMEKAQHLLDMFSSKRGQRGFRCHHEPEGSIFAFQNTHSTLDTLLLNDSRLVYNTEDMSFISSNHHSILKSPRQIVLSHHGKSFVANEPFTSHCCR